MRLAPERNPALGYRAIRMYAEHAELVERQLRAILRAGAVGPVKVMFPMVATPEEARDLRALVEKVKGRLAAEGVPHDAAIQIGVMLEIPSAVLSVRAIAREVDFFSVGSNDLAQYLFAVDREDTRLAHLGSPFHPAFLRLLSEAVEGAHAAGRWIGLCGELGARPLAAPLLLGLGFDEVSVSPPRVLLAKAAFRRTTARGGARRSSPTRSRRRRRGRWRRSSSSASRPRAPSSTPRRCGSSRGAGAATRRSASSPTSSSSPGASTTRTGSRTRSGRGRRRPRRPSGFGIAIPHCVSPHVRADSIAAVRLSPARGVGRRRRDGRHGDPDRRPAGRGRASGT